MVKNGFFEKLNSQQQFEEKLKATEKYREIKKRLSKAISMPNLEKEEIEYLDSPLGKGIYLHAIKNPPEDEPSNDIESEQKRLYARQELICKICNRKYKRSHSWDHKKTKIHQEYEKIDKKFRQMFFNHTE